MPEIDSESSTQAKFSKATALLKQLLEVPSLRAVLELDECSNAAQVYTHLPTLWLLVVQRLGGGLTLDQAVCELLRHHRDLLPNNKRVREGKLSENNSGYSRSRQNLALARIQAFSTAVSNHLASLSPPAFLDRQVHIIDGTTITFRPTPELKKRFPPATNQHGESVWPVAYLAVTHELRSGCAAVPQVAPMYGPEKRSELSLAKDAVDLLPPNSILLADSAYGIFSFAYHCVQRKTPFLFRLTQQRFKALVKSANLVEQSGENRTYHLVWNPSRKDRKKNPTLPEAAKIEVFLHQAYLPNGNDINLVTTLEVDLASAVNLYQERYKVEFDIRDLKVTMATEKILAKSYDTVMKELLGSVLAYNLVVQFRRQAATRVNLQPRELSFQGVWTTFQYFLLQRDVMSYQQWVATYEDALKMASRRKLPQRKSPRSSPRVAHQRSPKSASFKPTSKKKKAEPSGEKEDSS
ncbi:MAG: transposase [Pirellulaceae bacterium]|nr:transposase [Pirellulaceae bacterium]